MGQRIAILGAGPMGLAAAYQLTLDGHQAVLFEADDRVGGMAACFEFNGLEIERYYHFHCTSDDTLLRILDELGISEKMHWTETKMGYWYQGRLQPWGTPIALLKFKGLSFGAKVRYGLHAFLSTRRKNWQPLDNLGAAAWIRRWVGEEAYEILWRRLLDYKFHDYATRISAAWIWSRIHRLGRSRCGLFREKLGYLYGGSNTLVQALKASIEAGGGEIRLKSRVDRVIIENGKVRGLEIDGQLQTHCKVISTVPLPYIQRLMPDLSPDLLTKFQSIQNMTVVCVIVKLRKALTENFWVNINDPEMDIPGLVEYTNLRPLDQHIVYVPFYLPHEHPKSAEPDQAFVNNVKRYLQKISPDLSRDDFLDTRVNRYRYAQPICVPGHLRKLPPVALPVQGLWVADTSYYYPEDRCMSESIKFGRRLARTAVA